MSESLQHFSVERSPEEMNDPRTTPPPPSARVDLPDQPDSHPLTNASVPEPTPLPTSEDGRDFDRVEKMAYNWALAVFSISVTVLLTDRHHVHYPERVVLYAASTGLASLSLVAVVVLVYYSVISHPSAQLAKVQKKAMGFSALTLVLAVLSRLVLLMPFPFLLLMPFLFLLAVMASVIYSHRATASPNLFSTQN